MKAIILAAGMGSRLGEHTKDKPKCMVELSEKPLLEYQLDALRTIVDEIIIVRGYMADLIQYPDVQYIDNEEYATTNMVGSLMKARKEFEGDCLVCYSDIVYEPRILEIIEQSRGPVGVTIDTDFTEHWSARMDNPSEDMESLKLSDDGSQIVSLGNPKPSAGEVDARYVGLIKFNEEGTDAFKRVHDKHEAIEGDRTQRWYNSKSFRTAYMTDMLQAMIDDDIPVEAIKVQRGWLEMDTEEDHARYHEWIRNKTMSRFCRLFKQD